ncbi:hypothetical protein GDO81_019515 [Engystomops pustulosus]|uniref:Uncharacterized protein n=1 Tax=Engystomops pustulosus TaxID=76066 RepID=A0AAV6YKS2_ENGPU|nr:hypothetical protein GDO81_019515 [Engystomops pustulosus]
MVCSTWCQMDISHFYGKFSLCATSSPYRHLSIATWPWSLYGCALLQTASQIYMAIIRESQFPSHTTVTYYKVIYNCKGVT